MRVPKYSQLSREPHGLKVGTRVAMGYGYMARELREKAAKYYGHPSRYNGIKGVNQSLG